MPVLRDWRCKPTYDSVTYNKNKPNKMHNTFFFTSKVCWMILGLMFESFGGRFDRKKLLDLGGMDEFDMEVDENSV